MLCENVNIPFLVFPLKIKILWYKEYLKCISYLIDHLQIITFVNVAFSILLLFSCINSKVLSGVTLSSCQ